MRLIAFDVGGSHIAAALCETEPLRLLGRLSLAVDSAASGAAFYRVIDELVAMISENSGVAASDLDGMTFAFPGPFDYSRGVSLLKHKFASLHGTDLRRELSSRFGLQPTRVEFVNDADAFLLGELTQLPSARVGKAVGITLGTGVGSAFTVNGQIVRAGEGIPKDGEIWCLPWQGGIVEDAISTRAIQGLYHARTGRTKTVKEIAESSPGDSTAAAVFQEFGEVVGAVLRTVTAEFQPTAFVFGGAISRSAQLFLPSVAGQLNWSIALHVSTLFEEAALFGAAAHWISTIHDTGIKK